MRVIYCFGVSVLLLFAGTAHAQVDLSGAWGQRFHAGLWNGAPRGNSAARASHATH